LKRWWALLALPVMAACGEEGPTEVGAGLLPPDAVRTFEVILEAHQYMVYDTAFGLYSDPADAAFMVVANQFDGALDAHGLARWAMPQWITVTDTLGAVQVDSMPRFVRGEVRVVVDTLRSGSPPVRLALYRTAEPWDSRATWTYRTDVAGTRTRWNVPGGRGGVLIDTATWVARTDTVARDTLRFRVDSATMALWADTANAARGALFVAETGGARVRLGLPMLTVQARSRFRPDTLIEAFTGLQRKTYVFAPEQPESASQPRVGGTPAWRTIVQLRERLDTLTFACPGVPNCRARLGDVTINYAALQLQPVPSPAGFRPEADLSIGAYTLLPTALVPLQRSPMVEFMGSVTVPASRFLAPDTPGTERPVTELPVTELLRRTTMRPGEVPAGAMVPTHFALTQPLDPLFGFGAFESMPRLRLVVTIVQELQLP
jgi:hypothetical protein